MRAMNLDEWTPERLKEARRQLGLSQAALAAALRIKNARTIRKWEDGENDDISGPATVALEYMLGDPRGAA